MQEPTVDMTDRESILRWLVWNDPNGCYLDEECDEEGNARWTLDDALKAYREQGGSL